MESAQRPNASPRALTTVRTPARSLSSTRQRLANREWGSALIGRGLVKVERLGWCESGALAERAVGPVHLVFDGGRGLFVSGRSDWSLEVVETAPGDSAWLTAYDYDWHGSRWVLRDASGEAPFAAVIAERLAALEPVRDEVGEVVGLDLGFGGRTVTLRMSEGEVTT